MKQTFLICLLMLVSTVASAKDIMRLAVTTSFHNSGLADVLLPEIAKDLDLRVDLLVVGTGQALKLGRAGDVDAILVHSQNAEERFVAEGFGTHRREIMYNDFIIVGPKSDPTGVAGAKTAIAAMRAMKKGRSKFVSRGDDSGTHKKETGLWAKAGFDSGSFGRWYHAVGAGMGAALNTASGLNAYILSDRASWLNFGNKGDLVLLFAGDPILFNQYSYLPVNPERHNHVEAELAEKLENWLTSPRAAELIDAYQLNGESLFIFNATN